MVEHVGVFSKDRLATIAAEIKRRTGARKDYVAGRAKLDVVPNEEGEGYSLVLKNGKDTIIPLKRSALAQVASSLDVPLRYLERLTGAGHRDLAATNLGELLAAESTNDKGERRQLVRTRDGFVDAFLSDRYRSIAHDDVAAVALEEFKRAGVTVWDLKLTDTEFRISAVAPHIVGEITTDRNFSGHTRWEGKAGDVLNAGISIGNSETGHGSFYGKPAIWRRVCQNFCVWADGVARVHLGKRLEEGEVAFTSEATRSLEDQALVSKLRDVIRTTFNPEAFRKAIDAINATTRRELGDSPITVVDAAIKAYGLSPERKDAILAELLGSGDVSQYGLVQSITAQVNPQNAATLDDAIRSTFEDAGGSLLRLNDQGWRSFLRDAYKPAKDAAEVEATRQHVRLS